MRHIPEELRANGDAADVLIMGSVAVGYVMRNSAGVDVDQAAEPAPGRPPDTSVAPAPQPTGPPPAPPSQQVPTAPAPSVIIPDL